MMHYGPLTIHQNGKVVKHLMATPAPVAGASSRIAHSLDNVRLSMHVQRFEANDPYSADMTCTIRFREYGYELRHNAPCEMRAGQMHGSAIVQVTCISVDFENAHNTSIEVEYSSGDTSLAKMSVPLRFPAAALNI